VRKDELQLAGTSEVANIAPPVLNFWHFPRLYLGSRAANECFWLFDITQFVKYYGIESLEIVQKVFRTVNWRPKYKHKPLDPWINVGQARITT
jgi:hypothetical protein